MLLCKQKIFANKCVKQHYKIKKRYIALKADKKDEPHYENYQVFQHQNIIYNDNVNVNISDVDDHLEATCKLKKTDKDDYFMSHGLDYDRCYEYINIVKYFNRCWEVRHFNQNTKRMTNDNIKNTERHPAFVAGLTILSVISFVYYFVKEDL